MTTSKLVRLQRNKKKNSTSNLVRLQRNEMQRKIDVTRAVQLRRMKLRWKLQWAQNKTRERKAAIKRAKKEQLEVQKQINIEKLKATAEQLDKTKFFDFVYRIGGEKARKQKKCGFPLTSVK